MSVVGNYEYSIDACKKIGLFLDVPLLDNSGNRGYKVYNYHVENPGTSIDWSIRDNEIFDGIPAVILNFEEDNPIFEDLPQNMVPIFIVNGKELRNFSIFYKYGMAGIYVIHSKFQI